MGTLNDAALKVLEPFAGPMLAGMCLRAAASAAGKPADSLTGADLPALRGCAEGILRPLAPAETIKSLMDQVERSVV